MKPSTRDEEPLKRDGNAENRKHAFRVGSHVERELEGFWFPATIVAVDEDHNCETDIAADELRHLGESVERPKTPAVVPTLTPQQRELMRKDSLLFTTDYDPNKRPTVVLHHQGESHAASGYIINGLENNIAAGNGLRGIRWLRVNTL